MFWFGVRGNRGHWAVCGHKYTCRCSNLLMHNTRCSVSARSRSSSCTALACSISLRSSTSIPLLLNCTCMYHVPRGGKLCGHRVVALCGGRVGTVWNCWINYRRENGKCYWRWKVTDTHFNSKSNYFVTRTNNTLKKDNEQKSGNTNLHVDCIQINTSQEKQEFSFCRNSAFYTSLSCGPFLIFDWVLNQGRKTAASTQCYHYMDYAALNWLLWLSGIWALACTTTLLHEHFCIYKYCVKYCVLKLFYSFYWCKLARAEL